MSTVKNNEKSKLTNINYSVAIYYLYCSVANIANHNVLVIIFIEFRLEFLAQDLWHICAIISGVMTVYEYTRFTEIFSSLKCR